MPNTASELSRRLAAKCGGRLPPLSLQRLSPRSILARRRRRQHARQQPIRSPAWTRSRPGCCGQMDRRRDRRAWRLARPHRRQSQSRCSRATVLEEARRFLQPPGARGIAAVMRQSPSIGWIARSGTTPICCVPGRSPARLQRRICGNGASRLCGIARPFASIRACYYRQDGKILGRTRRNDWPALVASHQRSLAVR